MKYTVTYASRTPHFPDLYRVIFADNEQDALKDFKIVLPGVEDFRIKSILPEPVPEPEPKPLPNPVLSHGPYTTVLNKGIYYWTDPTGERLQARFDIVSKLPNVLLKGKANARRVPEVLNLMGLECNDSNKRELRRAKSFLVANTNHAICSFRSTDGGYYIAENMEEVLSDMEAQLKHAEGMIRSAKELRGLAFRAFEGNKHV